MSEQARNMSLAPDRRPDHLYVIQSAAGPIKVGRSVNPTERLTKLQAGSHRKLRLVAVFEGRGGEEPDIHYAMQEHRVHGEWFSNNTPAVDALVALLGPVKVRRRTPRPVKVPSEPNPWDDHTPVYDHVKEKLDDRNKRMLAFTKALREGRLVSKPAAV